ncbi:hypothetical protein CYLTODRAFT_460718 [Cylindrobasidium torrendii FP15055 ss-10]|uniref:Uncharacterized protein n=1 Tax=Cylindrobasidium torrendii FP15055 ss-10 TaxID=1314674 RepID=A0A0D7AR73_9AGAR|nr:hypothetical protein CYLTODRAFT_460718 [Cylindrobasidium torrendii FP15055 ss-10]
MPRRILYWRKHFCAANSDIPNAGDSNKRQVLASSIFNLFAPTRTQPSTAHGKVLLDSWPLGV